jgi:hypothetical protein
VLVDFGPSRYLVVEGQGAPGDAVFQSRIAALYAMAFTVKMTRKFAGRGDYPVGKLEALYLNVGQSPTPPRQRWKWRLMIRTPEFIGEDDLSAAVSTLRKRGKEGEATLVRLDTLLEGPCVQMLHVGPYDRESDTIETMREFAGTKGLELAGPHHEIYISDPRRVEPEKLKTILRCPAVPAK